MVLNEDTVKRLDESISPHSDIFLKPGDVLVQRSNTLELVGTTAIFDGPADEYVYPDLMMRLRFRAQETAHWFWRYANSCAGRGFFLGAAAGSTGSMPKLSGANLRNMPLPFPPLPEQGAIAEMLSDVDALLGGLDRLIAKKRDLKQAAMQQLLTGQTRLPGFRGEWEVNRLDMLAEIISGSTPKTTEPAFWHGGIKWCTPTDITSCAGKYLMETERTISALGLENCTARMLPAGALLLCSRATIGEIKIAGCEVCTNQGFKSLVCKPGVSNEFLYYKLLTMKQQMTERAIGSTFLEISRGETATLKIQTPRPEEQRAIAEALTEMDSELAALEQRREKSHALKRAMMQELLTGRIRLV
jgi:type I restriction enzyme S subunit